MDAKINITIRDLKSNLLLLFLGVILFLFSNDDISKLKALNITLYDVLFQYFRLNQQILPFEILDKYIFITLVYCLALILILCSIFCLALDILNFFAKNNDD